MCSGIFCLTSTSYKFNYLEKEWCSIEECLKYTEESALENIMIERIKQNEELQMFLKNTNMRPVITYESSLKSKKICEILIKIRLSL